MMPDYLLIAGFDSAEFNRRPSSKNKMYNDVDFDDRFRHQLTIFEGCILMWLSRLLDIHIAYEMAI